MPKFLGERIWVGLNNVWTTFFVGFLIVNFFEKDRFEALIGPFSIIYIGILGFYVGTKEFARWYDIHDGRHPGEVFVIVWTILMLAFLILPLFLGQEYRTSTETVTDYLIVLSIFALTQHSKRLHKKHTRISK